MHNIVHQGLLGDNAYEGGVGEIWEVVGPNGGEQGGVNGGCSGLYLFDGFGE